MVLEQINFYLANPIKLATFARYFYILYQSINNIWFDIFIYIYIYIVIYWGINAVDHLF